MIANRRMFLKMGSAGILGAMSMQAMAVPTSVPQKWDAEFDVVIVGAGGAGLTAGVVSLQKGMTAVVLEKMAIIGGSSLLCGGKYATYDTPLQREKGIKDSEKLFYEDMLKTGQYKNDPELVKVYVKASRDQYDYLTKERGIQPLEITAAAGMSVPRAHNFEPPVVMADLRKVFEEKGGKLMLRTKAERLTWDFQKNVISGVKASIGEKTIYIRAKKGVILAAGGFDRNPAMLEKYNPLMGKAAVVAGAGTQGDGILMAQAYGADVLDTNYIKATFGFTLNPKTAADISQFQYGGAIIVNNKGKRFVNESLSYKLLGDAALAQDKGQSFVVFDDNIRKYQVARRIIDRDLMKPYEEGKEPSYSIRANTLEEAAKKAGIPVEELKKTVERYNRMVEQGKDEDFGRTTLTGGFGKPVKLVQGPFYIIPVTSGLIGTYCGVKINPKAQVIDIFGEVIPHLYAAGEMTGGVHGAAYMTGTAWGKAMTFGRIAASTIAESK